MRGKTSLDCSEIRKHLPDFLNESLDATTAQQMRRHFERCTDCRMIVFSAMDTFRQFFPEKRAENFLHKTHAA
jgi:predicted anti-sigma-YlaC factor YlaD